MTSLDRLLSALPGTTFLRDLWRSRSRSFAGVRRHPPGHFYSPLLDLDRLAAAPEEFIDREGKLWGGIDLRVDAQRELLKEFLGRGLPFELPREATPRARYHWDNEFFRFADGFALASMLQHAQPCHVVEVGSGFSTALMLDAADRLELPVRLTAIEPFPDRLRSLLKAEDATRVNIIEQRVQDAPTEVFEQLGENDLLFIDSSHVAKVGSDVADLFLRILPRLQPGVLVHFHDIFYPGAYPEVWLRQGCAWNEGLFLRAFLQFNRAFEIVWFNAFVGQLCRAEMAEALPLFLADTGGSIYLRRIA